MPAGTPVQRNGSWQSEQWMRMSAMNALTVTPSAPVMRPTSTVASKLRCGHARSGSAPAARSTGLVGVLMA
jgi:hypothetical protein